MKEYKYLTEKPWYTMCSEEWKRAKKIIHFNCDRPKFFWNKRKRGGWVAFYSRNGHFISFHDSWKQLKMTEEVIKEFRDTLRHEFAHIHTKGHGNDFVHNMERLGGTRYCGISLPKSRQVEKVKK